MSFKRQLVKVTIIGDSFNQGEIWTTGFHMGQLGNSNSTLPGNMAQGIAAAWETFFKSTTSSISSRYRTVSVKANIIGTDGKQITNPTQEYFYPIPIVGGNLSAPLPPQISLVASLRTDQPRGDATHGRMYLPGINFGVDSDARITAANRTAVAGTFKSFIDGCNSFIDGQGLRVLVASAKGTGQDRQVTKLMIGDLYDTQRRRRNAFTEQYTTVLPATGGSF